MDPISLYIFLWHFSIGVLSILSLLGWLVYFQSGEKSFLYYAAYSLFVLGYLLFKLPPIYHSDWLVSFYNSRYYPLTYLIQVFFYSCYFYFFFHFLQLNEIASRFVFIVKKIIRVTIIISILLAIYSIIIFNEELYFNFFTFCFTPIFLILAVLTVVHAFKSRGKLKYFVIIGSFIYIVFALIAMYFTLNPEKWGAPLIFFYIGLIIENIAFSIGLSLMVKGWYEKMIYHFKENVRIRRNQFELLEKELEKKEKAIIEMDRQAEKERVEKIEADFNSEIRRLQLDVLMNQMNPHFIFNALTSVKVFLIDNDKKKAVFYLNRFSKLIRKMLDSNRVQSYSLEEELEILKLYLSIENIRFNSEINIQYNIDPEIDPKSIKIPPMVLQPFIENSIWHGLMLKTEGEKEIDIILKNEENNCFLVIEDNGIGRQKAQEMKMNRALKKNSYGMKLVQERLDIFNKQNNFNYHFEITDLTDSEGNSCGTRVTINFNKN